MNPGSMFGWFGALRPLWRLVVVLGLVGLGEGLVRGVWLGLLGGPGTETLTPLVAQAPDWAAPYLPYLNLIEPLGLGGIGLWAALLCGRQALFRRRWWPAALAARAASPTVLEIRVPPDSTTPPTAFRDVLEKVFALVQADEVAVQRGEAVTPAWEIWSTPAGTALYCWLPAATPVATVQALAELIRAAYPGARVLRVDDPLRGMLAPAGQAGPAAQVGSLTFRLRAPASYPIRAEDAFQADPLTALLAAVRADPLTPLVGVSFLTTGYTGTHRTQVSQQLAALRAREVAIKTKKALPTTHAEDVLALQGQLDAYGFDMLIRVVVVSTASPEATRSVETRLANLERTFQQYDRQTGSRPQGLMRDERRQTAVPGGTAPTRLDAIAPERDRWVRPLPPFGRALQILNAGELATLFHLPTRAQSRLPGLICWQRAQMFEAPAPCRIRPTTPPGTWLATGIAKIDLPPPGAEPVPVGVPLEGVVQHEYFLGGTGSGKSEQLKAQTKQGFEAGRGEAVIDPKGDYAMDALLMVPPEREGEVCWFDPGDASGRIVGFNPMSAEAVRRMGAAAVQSEVVGIIDSLVAGSTVAIQMRRFMQHGLRLILDVLPEPSFLWMYLLFQTGDKETGNPFRERLLADALRLATDPTAVREFSAIARDFWANQVPGMKDSQLQSMQTALNRIEQFLANDLVMGVVAQPHSTVNLRRLMDTRGIFLCKLSPDQLGGDVQKFMGTLILTEIIRASFSRNNIPKEQRVLFRVTADEFQDFVNMAGGSAAFEKVLSQLRGLGVGMALAHQTLDQLPRELLGIIFGNVATKVFFPLRGDALIIAKLLGEPVRPEDLAGLDRFHMLQVLFGQTGSVGPVTVAPLPLARPAANPGTVGQVPATVSQQPAVAQWFHPPPVPVDALAVPGAIRDNLRRPAQETPAAQRARLTRLYRQLHGAEHDRNVTRILGALDERDLPVYVACRRVHDAQVRAAILAHPQLVPDKRARLKLLSDLQYGTPACEVRAQVQRVLGQREGTGIGLDADQITETGTARPAVGAPAGQVGRSDAPPELEGLTDMGGTSASASRLGSPARALSPPPDPAFAAQAPPGAVVWAAPGAAAAAAASDPAGGEGRDRASRDAPVSRSAAPLEALRPVEQEDTALEAPPALVSDEDAALEAPPALVSDEDAALEAPPDLVPDPVMIASDAMVEGTPDRLIPRGPVLDGEGDASRVRDSLTNRSGEVELLPPPAALIPPDPPLPAAAEPGSLRDRGSRPLRRERPPVTVLDADDLV